MHWGNAMSFLTKFLKDEVGATAIEYGLICGLLAIASVVVMQGLGSELQTTFAKSSVGMASANAGAS
jgi:pilus assembly protein Flp/PilA